MKCSDEEYCYVNRGHCHHTPDEGHSIVKKIDEKIGLTINTVFRPFWNTDLYFEAIEDENLLTNFNKILQYEHCSK